MKAKDLRAGVEYYYDPANSWMNSAYTGHRVVIIDPIPGNWTKGDYVGFKYVRPGDQNVLVELYERNDRDPAGRGSTPERMAVHPRALRGLWQETYDQHAKAKSERLQGHKALRDAQQVRINRCQQVVNLLGELGITATVEGLLRHDEARVVLSEDASVRLAEGLQELVNMGWKARTE